MKRCLTLFIPTINFDSYQQFPLPSQLYTFYFNNTVTFVSEQPRFHKLSVSIIRSRDVLFRGRLLTTAGPWVSREIVITLWLLICFLQYVPGYIYKRPFCRLLWTESSSLVLKLSIARACLVAVVPEYMYVHVWRLRVLARRVHIQHSDYYTLYHPERCILTSANVLSHHTTTIHTYSFCCPTR